MLVPAGIEIDGIERMVDFTPDSVMPPEKGIDETFVISTRSSVPSKAISVRRKRACGMPSSPTGVIPKSPVHSS